MSGVIALALLLGCGPKLGPPDVSYGPPGELPLVHTDRDRGRWYAVVDTGEHGEHLFFFDTGYSYTTCDDDFAELLGLELKGRAMVHGEAGRIPTKRARLPRVTVAGHTVEGWTCMVRDLNSTSSIQDSREVPIAGVLGTDVLRRFRVIIDPETSRVHLIPPPQAEPLDPKDPRVVRMRRERGWSPRVTVPLVVEGDVTLRPIIDTGASGTYVNASPLGREPDRVREGVWVRASGQKGRVRQDLAFYRVEAVALGLDSVEDITLIHRPKLGWTAGLLGLNVLGHYRVELDYQRRRARFTRVVPGEVPSWRQWSYRRELEEAD